MTLSFPGGLIRPARNAAWVCCVAGLIAAASASAQEPTQPSALEPAPPFEMKVPHIIAAIPDWDAARAALMASQQVAADNGTTATPASELLTQLNGAAGKILAGISASPLPVLLPLDTAALLRDQAQGAIAEPAQYLAGFTPALFFAGTSGYDAMLTLPNSADPKLTYVKPINVEISGFTQLYELDGPGLPDGKPVPDLDAALPGIRRVMLENRLRFTFERFGVRYVVSILCFEGANHERRLSCREADPVAMRLLKALTIAGGAPQPGQTPAVAGTIARPQQPATDFTYYAPGDLIAGSGMKGQDGRADTTVYSRIQFPMAQGPDFVNSQSFMNWGDCNFTGRVHLGEVGKYAAYRCKVNDKPLLADESKNYAYPWRDNFCEHRNYYVSQCPAGLGHQGEDIRPSTCLFRTDNAGRCEPYQNNVVAVRDGVLMRTPGDEALYLVVNQTGEHIRFRYLHMDPHMLDADGMVSGRKVSQDEVLGAVDNFGRSEGGTSYHLHFDIQVPTRDGWVFVNPYLTLVTAYERLIGGRGQAVRDPEVTTAATDQSGGDDQAASNAITATTPPAVTSESARRGAGAETAIPPAAGAAAQIAGESQRGRNKVAAEHCTTRFLKSRNRRSCGVAVVETRVRKGRALRSVVRDVPHHGRIGGHRGTDLQPRHARAASRRSGA